MIAPRPRAVFTLGLLALCVFWPFRLSAADLRINEFLSANRGGLADEDGE